MFHARFSRISVFGLLAGMALVASPLANAEILTNAQHALLMDYDSGEVLFCKACAEPMPPSSMSKLMTVELVFQRLKDGRLKPEDTFHVSETAWRQGQKDNESKMWVALNSDISVDDLLKGIIVQSGGRVIWARSSRLRRCASDATVTMRAGAEALSRSSSRLVSRNGAR